MKLELKKVSVNTRLSEETFNYTADLWFEGKKIGTVSNHGTGGPDDFRGDYAAFEKANAWCKANHPKTKLFDNHEIDTDIELWCGDQVQDVLTRKELKKYLKSKVLLKMPDEKSISMIAWKGVKVVEQRHIDAAKAKHPTAIILNTLDENQALALFKQYT